MAKQKTHEEFMCDFYDNGNPEIDVIGKYAGRFKDVMVRCKSYGHQYSTKPANLLRGDGCAVCSGRRLIPSLNSLAVIRPDLLLYFENQEDAYQVTYRSGQSVKLKCPDCGHIKNMLVSNLSERGFSCDVCGDGVSYPNKFIRCVMNQVNNISNLEYEWVPEWTNNRRFDVYFVKDDMRYVVEMQGEQHYGRGRNKNVPLDDLIIDDNDKANGAILNNVTPIIIDARLSNPDFIWNNIKTSLLSEIIDLSIIDVDKCKMLAAKNIIKQVCDDYNLNPNVILKNLAEKYKIHPLTISNYLKQGNSLGWCQYSTPESLSKHRQRRRNAIDVFNANGELVLSSESALKCAQILSALIGVKFYDSNICKAAKFGKPYHDLYFQYT